MTDQSTVAIKQRDLDCDPVVLDPARCSRLRRLHCDARMRHDRDS